MASNRETTDPWEACTSGELSRMVRRLDKVQIRARRKQFFSTALLSTAVFACLVFVVGSMAAPPGGIRCSYCNSHMAEYYAHVMGKLVHEDAVFVASMKSHLEKCDRCRSKFGAMYPDRQAAACLPAIRSETFVTRQPMFAALAAQRSW